MMDSESEKLKLKRSTLKTQLARDRRQAELDKVQMFLRTKDYYQSQAKVMATRADACEAQAQSIRLLLKQDHTGVRKASTEQGMEWIRAAQGLSSDGPEYDSSLEFSSFMDAAELRSEDDNSEELEFKVSDDEEQLEADSNVMNIDDVDAIRTPVTVPNSDAIIL